MTGAARRVRGQFKPIAVHLLLRLFGARASGVRRLIRRDLPLLRSLTQRELTARYRGSLLGAVWALLTPFFMMLLYTVVFSIFLRVRLSSDASPTAFALYLLAGLLPWTAFAEAAGRAVSVMLEQASLVKKVAFPLEIIPLSTTAASLLNHVVGLALFLVIVLALRGWHWTLLLLPVVALPYVMLTVGVVLILASLGVFVRDLTQAIGLLLTAWLFLTPILYLEEQVPVRMKLLIRLNPFTSLVHNYRLVILDGRIPDPADILALYATGTVVCGLGFWWFGRTKAAFADVL